VTIFDWVLPFDTCQPLYFLRIYYFVVLTLAKSQIPLR